MGTDGNEALNAMTAAIYDMNESVRLCIGASKDIRDAMIAAGYNETVAQFFAAQWLEHLMGLLVTKRETT